MRSGSVKFGSGAVRTSARRSTRAGVLKTESAHCQYEVAWAAMECLPKCKNVLKRLLFLTDLVLTGRRLRPPQATPVTGAPSLQAAPAANWPAR